MIVSIAIALALGMLTLYCILFFRENGTTENPLEPLKKTLNSARIGEVELLTPPRNAIDVLRDPPKLQTVPNDFPAPIMQESKTEQSFDYDQVVRSFVQEEKDKLAAIKAKFCTPKYYTLCFKALTKEAMDTTGASFTEISLTGLLVMNVGDIMSPAEKNVLFNGFSDLCTSKGVKNRQDLFGSIRIDRLSYLDYLTKIINKENSNNKQGE